MRAYELPVKLDQDGKVELPADIKEVLKEAAEVRMILLIEGNDERDWAQASREGFAAGYGEADSVYDALE